MEEPWSRTGYPHHKANSVLGQTDGPAEMGREGQPLTAAPGRRTLEPSWSVHTPSGCWEKCIVQALCVESCVSAGHHMQQAVP